MADATPEPRILVVGRSLAALSTLAFLDRAGFDPVLADGTHRIEPSRVVTLWRPGLASLERLGMGAAVESVGTPLTELRCVGHSRTWTADDSSPPSLVALRWRRLESLFDRMLGPVRTLDRSVESCDASDAGVDVTFGDDTRETFDAVVTTDPTSLLGRRGMRGTAPVHQWAFDWPRTVSTPTTPTAPTEAWGDGAAAFAVPVGDAVRGILVADDGAWDGTPLALDRLAERFGALWDTLGEAIADVDEYALRYSRLPYAVPRTVTNGRVALVGPRARASIPGDCLGDAFAVADGRLLAESLAAARRPVDVALREYATRRRRQSRAVAAVVESDAIGARADESASPSALTRHLRVHRTLAFDHVFDADADADIDVDVDALLDGGFERF